MHFNFLGVLVDGSKVDGVTTVLLSGMRKLHNSLLTPVQSTVFLDMLSFSSVLNSSFDFHSQLLFFSASYLYPGSNMHDK